MGTYDTRAGRAISPEIDDFVPSKLVEDVLALLEAAGLDTATNDKIAGLIEAAEAATIKSS